jgi:hypothetical protein
LADWLVQTIEAIQALPAHNVAREQLWVVPTFQTIHILAVGLVFSASLIVALRALDIAGTYWTLARWHRRFSLGTGLALVALLVSGGILVLAEPERELLNSLFQIKIPLVVATTLLSYGVARQFGTGDRRITMGVRLGAILIFLLWAVIIGLGRWIAYAG